MQNLWSDGENLRRVRLGLLIPSSNTTMEYEFNLMRPRQATVHTARIRLREVVVSELLDMEKKIAEEARALLNIVLLYGLSRLS